MSPCRVRRARRAVALAIAALGATACELRNTEVANPTPVKLARPKAAPLSAMALLGRAVFYDTTLSATGTRSCEGCHRLENAYAPLRTRGGSSGVNDQDGTPVVRAVPSLRYAYRAPEFSVGPELIDADQPPAQLAPPVAPGERTPKLAEGPSRADAIVARGGLFWDGRVNTLQDQAMGPLFNGNEMGNTSVESVAARLERAPYARHFVTLFGVDIFAVPARLVDEAMFAVARYQIEDSTFHPYDSKYDHFLEGKAKLSESEWRGLRAFEDPKRGNCAACHLDRPTANGLPPTFTDYEYEALGVPRGSGVARGSVPDLGACGPIRTDLRNQGQYCGMFRTPSLRNSATRADYFHNGAYHTLDDVLKFYNFRDTRPESIYPSRAGVVDKFNDLPLAFRGNVDTVDAPFDRKRGSPPPMTEQEMRDIVAFLRTLSDGWRPPR